MNEKNICGSLFNQPIKLLAVQQRGVNTRWLTG
jgi:hypothetical protein